MSIGILPGGSPPRKSSPQGDFRSLGRGIIAQIVRKCMIVSDFGVRVA